MDTLTFVLILFLVRLFIENISLRKIVKRLKNLEDKAITTDKIEKYQEISRNTR